MEKKMTFIDFLLFNADILLIIALFVTLVNGVMTESDALYLLGIVLSGLAFFVTVKSTGKGIKDIEKLQLLKLTVAQAALAILLLTITILFLMVKYFNLALTAEAALYSTLGIVFIFYISLFAFAKRMI